ncbi:MAG: outer membrane protein assembly factor BamD, partial [Bacteroidota bacterium]
MFRKGSAVSLLFVVFVALITYTCGDYKKVLKSTDLQYKYDRAIQYYDEGECYKAYPLFEELLAVYRGTKKSEDIYYRLAYCDYRLKDYILASHRFEQFYNNFPYSGKAEECTFMSAYCHYLNSPKPSLDQTDTEEAITAFRLFVNKYPYSPRIDTCNVLMDE